MKNRALAVKFKNVNDGTFDAFIDVGGTWIYIGYQVSPSKPFSYQRDKSLAERFNRRTPFTNRDLENLSGKTVKQLLTRKFIHVWESK